jgi:hypothetical protein
MPKSEYVSRVAGLFDEIVQDVATNGETYVFKVTNTNRLSSRHPDITINVAVLISYDEYLHMQELIALTEE